MTDFNAYKAGDSIKLSMKVVIEENKRHCSCCEPDYYNREITAEFKILQVVKRGNDFIFIFERSTVFDEELSFSDGRNESEVITLAESFVLDSLSLDYGYIRVIDPDEENKRKLQEIKKLKQMTRDLLKGINQYKEEYTSLNKQLDALNDFADSAAYKLILNRMTGINHLICKNKEELNKASVQIKILENTCIL